MSVCGILRREAGSCANTLTHVGLRMLLSWPTSISVKLRRCLCTSLTALATQQRRWNRKKATYQSRIKTQAALLKRKTTEESHFVWEQLGVVFYGRASRKSGVDLLPGFPFPLWSLPEPCWNHFIVIAEWRALDLSFKWGLIQLNYILTEQCVTMKNCNRTRCTKLNAQSFVLNPRKKDDFNIT